MTNTSKNKTNFTEQAFEEALAAGSLPNALQHMISETHHLLNEEPLQPVAQLKGQLLAYMKQRNASAPKIHWWNYRIPIYQVAVAAALAGVLLVGTWLLVNHSTQGNDAQVIYVEKKDTIYVPANSPDVNSKRTVYTVWNPKTGRYETVANATQVAQAIDSTKHNGPLTKNRNNKTVGSLAPKQSNKQQD